MNGCARAVFKHLADTKNYTTKGQGVKEMSLRMWGLGGEMG